MKALTARQSEVLAMVGSFRAKHGFSPSTRDIQRHFGFASQTAATSHLQLLRRKGAIDWSPRRSRTVSAEPVAHLPSQSPQFTYLLHDSVSGKVKIGCSSNIKQRQSMLETAFPCKLTLLALIPTAELPERAAHKKFKADRIRGEWFEYSDAIKTFVEQQEASRS